MSENPRNKHEPAGQPGTPKRTGRKRRPTATEIRHREETIARFVETSPNGLCTWNLDGNLTYTNQRGREILGLNRPLHSKMRFDDPEFGITRLDGSPLPAEEHPCALVLASNESVFGAELLFHHLDGAVVAASINAAPLHDQQGRPAVVAALTDITEKMEIEAQIRAMNTELEYRVLERTALLQAANRELEAFSYSVAHDLRAPLRTIVGFTRIVMENSAEQLDSQSRSYLERVCNAGDRMGGLMDALLSLSRVTRRPLEHEPVDLSALALRICDELQAAAPDRSAAFDIEPGLAAPGSQPLLQIALMNLLGNAWKFTSHEPAAKIAFGADRTNDQLTYFLRDNGAGFEMAYVDRLFRPFQRLHTVSEFEGTGIGLATVQRIIERHGGRVWAESAPGQGATFYFTLG
ncbi:MAG TPA: ATP-binding protein [Armatimonadota bacterium]|nr:ATP-binding protein [Armatimonadota bacterium]